MNLSAILTTERVLLGFRAADKWAAIEAMAEAIAATGGVSAGLLPTAREALLERERSMTTGMEFGVAIPHAAMDDLEGIAGVLALAPDGIPFATLDGQPGRILVCLLIPRQEKLAHIRTLAGIANLLSEEDVRQSLLRAATPAEVLDTIREAE